MNRKLDIYCADPGSIPKGNFGWAGSFEDETERSSRRIDDLAAAISKSLREGRRVALGFECPLFIPTRDMPDRLLEARRGEGNRAWSAGAAPCAMAAGLAELTWVLRTIRDESGEVPPAFLSWSTFAWASFGLLIWEAFVTGPAKSDSHEGDALIAVQSFRRQLPSPQACINGGTGLSLAGAALLATGWSTDQKLLREPCLVVGAIAPTRGL